MSTGHHRPLEAILPPCLAVHLKAVVPPPLHIPDVHLVLQNTMDGGICPVGSGRQPVVVAVFLAGEPLVLAGAGDALLVQLLGNTDLAHSVFKQGEDAPHHLRRRRINDQTVVILRVLAIPVAGKSPDEFAPLLLGVERAFDLLGNVSGVLGVEQILQRQGLFGKAVDGEDIDGNTAAAYLDIFKRLFITDNQPPFSVGILSSVRVKQAEKRHFSDPSLACALLKAAPAR